MRITIENTTYGPGDYVPELYVGGTPLGMISSAFSATEESWEFFKNRSRWIPADNRPPELVSYSPEDDVTVNETGNGTVSFSVEATDPDAHQLHYTWNVDGVDREVDNKTFTFAFNFTSAGTYNISVNITDGYAVINHSWILTIADVNRAPVIETYAPALEHWIDETGDGILMFTVTVSDPDDDPLTSKWLIDGEEVHGETGQALGFTYDYTSAGNYSVTFSVTDGYLEVQLNWTLHINNSNRVPLLDTIPPARITVGNTFTWQVNATDPDVDDILTFGLETSPDGMDIDSSTGAINWTPTANDIGTNRIVVEVTDGIVTVNTSFNITVVPREPENRPPQILNIVELEAVSGKEFTCTVEATDPDPWDLVNLSFSLETGPAGMIIDQKSGNITWTPGKSDAGRQTFIVNVTDGKDSVNATFTIHVKKKTVDQPVNVGGMILIMVLVIVVIVAAITALLFQRRGRSETESTEEKEKEEGAEQEKEESREDPANEKESIEDHDEDRD
jgi:hypothetical protein